MLYGRMGFVSLSMFVGAVKLSGLLIVPLTDLLFCDRRFGVHRIQYCPPAISFLLDA
jgi:hypothetical protein